MATRPVTVLDKSEVLSGLFAVWDDIGVLLHPSGTTGSPKLVPLTHRHQVAAFAQADGIFVDIHPHAIDRQQSDARIGHGFRRRDEADAHARALTSGHAEIGHRREPFTMQLNVAVQPESVTLMGACPQL